MVPPQLRQQSSNCSLLLIYQPHKVERLSWPGWLTCSGSFTYISGHPSATARAQAIKVRQPKIDILPLCTRPTWWGPCFVFPSVLWHWSVDRKDIWTTEPPVSLIPRASVLEQVEEDNPMGNQLTQCTWKWLLYGSRSTLCSNCHGDSLCWWLYFSDDCVYN